MSFALINPIDGSVVTTYQQGEHMDLTAAMSVFVEPLSTAVIPHPEIIWMNKGGYSVWPVAGVFIRFTLIIPVEHIQVDDRKIYGPHGGLKAISSYLATPVFNFGPQRIRIEKGFVISRLVAI